MVSCAHLISIQDVMLLPGEANSPPNHEKSIIKYSCSRMGQAIDSVARAELRYHVSGAEHRFKFVGNARVRILIDLGASQLSTPHVSLYRTLHRSVAHLYTPLPMLTFPAVPFRWGTSDLT